MLSEQEQRTFREIEQRIAADDPQFALAIQRLGTRRAGGRSTRGYDLVVVLAALSGLLCLVLALAGAAIVALGLAAAAYFLRDPLPSWLRWPGRRPRRRS
jgi:hypothetical protein